MTVAELNASLSGGALRFVDAGDGVLVLEIDVPGRPVNVLTSAVLADLERALAAVAAEPAFRALVVANGKKGSRTFIAGADIEEIRSVTDPRQAAALAARGQEIFSLFARMEKPTVAAIGGTCLGGGTEMVLACDLRVAADDPGIQIGLPEVLLGIIPGFGGTQRLPRLVGIRAALDLILTGKRIDPRKAAQIGLVDRLALPPLLREEAVRMAREALGRKAGPRKKALRPRKRRKLGDRLATLFLERTPWGRALIRRAALKGIRARGGDHYPAPFRAVEAVLGGFPRKLSAGLELEARLVGELVAGQVSKNLIALFQSGEALRRGPREEEEQERMPEAPPRRVVVLGAGVMGGAIAALLVRRGFRVRIKDIRPEAIGAALGHAAKAFDELVARRRMTRRERENHLAAISATTEYTGLRGAEVLIEAVVEDLEVKKKVLREVEPLLDAGAVFASNTSALSITALQSAAARPERVVGLHFFNPVHRMPLVEVVHGERTSPATVRAAERFAREIGKYPVRVKDGPGFLVNRLLMPYLNEAAHLFLAGAPLEALDAAMREFGFPMGPFELLDEVGLDVAAKVAHILHAAFGERAAPAPLIGVLVGEEKLLGKKGGAGFYLHRGKKRVPNPAALRHNRPAHGSPPAGPAPAGGGAKGATAQEPQSARWVERMLYPMVNEAARCLEEGIVESPGDVDLASVMGMAFPPFRGGLLTHADSTGIPKVVESLNRFAAEAADGASPERFRPAPLLLRLASEGRPFSSLAPPPRAPGGDRLAPTAAPALAGG